MSKVTPGNTHPGGCACPDCTRGGWGMLCPKCYAVQMFSFQHVLKDTDKCDSCGTLLKATR